MSLCFIVYCFRLYSVLVSKTDIEFAHTVLTPLEAGKYVFYP